jgi:hypothetical protein
MALLRSDDVTSAAAAAASASVNSEPFAPGANPSLAAVQVSPQQQLVSLLLLLPTSAFISQPSPMLLLLHSVQLTDGTCRRSTSACCCSNCLGRCMGTCL